VNTGIFRTPPEGPPAAKGPSLVPEPMLFSRGLPLTVCNHSSGRCKKKEVPPDLNPDLAGIGVSGFPKSRFGRDPEGESAAMPWHRGT
jgi:hypothetical protein